MDESDESDKRLAPPEDTGDSGSGELEPDQPLSGEHDTGGTDWEAQAWDTSWARGNTAVLMEDTGEIDAVTLWGGAPSVQETTVLPGTDTATRETEPKSELEDEFTTRLNSTLSSMGNLGASLGRVGRLRLLLRRRPAAAALLAFFLLGLLLTSCAPLLPLLRLGFDASDAYRRAQSLQALFAGGSASLLNTANLHDAQSQLDALSHDLYEINSVVSSLGAPVALVSPSLRDDRLLVRIGSDLSASADEGLQVVQTILTPLQGGALAVQGSGPGITPADLRQAQSVLADAQLRVQDALAAYTQLDPTALPAQLQPGSKLGGYLQLLPQAPQVLAELSALMAGVPQLLGVGQPANYLVMALDRSELRPIGGFAGNYGILQLDNGEQSTSNPFFLEDVYTLDQQYFKTNLPQQPTNDCDGQGVQPPEYYWWWPYRNLGCQYGWGLRDMGLSPSFPTDAQTAMQIVQDTPNAVSNNAPLQGVIAFTPVLIQRLMSVTGNITLNSAQYGGTVVVTPQNLEYLIHRYQLVINTGVTDRKAFTHDLAAVMLTKIKTLHGSQLKSILNIAVQALKSKDLEVYFANPNAELILQQLGLASDIQTGNGDGFYVVDTNDGGDKANTYVSEQQTDVVTLLPNGGALHHLEIAVTYNRQGDVFGSGIDDYLDMQRTYLPGDANILGFAGFNPPTYSGVGVNCRNVSSRNDLVSTIATDCSDDQGIHAFTTPVTTSDVPGRSMVMGAVTVNCGPDASLLATNTTADSAACETTPSSNTQDIFIEWYTPHAFTMNAAGHGTYSELVQEQPGSGDFILGAGDYLTVYVDTSQLHSASPKVTTAPVTSNGAFGQLYANLTPVQGFKKARLDSDMTVSVNF